MPDEAQEDSIEDIVARAEAQAEEYEKARGASPADEGEAAPSVATTQEETETPATEETSAESAKEGDDDPEKEAAAKKEKEPEEADSEEVAQLKELAEKNGFDFDGKKVTLGERKAWREKYRAEKEQIHGEYQAAVQELEQKGLQLEQKFAPAAQMVEAIKKKDFDGIAKGAGFENWRQMNETFAREQLDPAFLKIKELEKSNREREEALERERARRTEEQRAIEAQRQERAWADDVALELESSEDPVFQAISKDDEFVQSIIYFQKQHYDPVENTTISVAQAAKLSLENAAKTLTKLQSILGQPATEKSTQPDSGASAGKPVSRASAGKRVPKAISQRSTAEASQRDNGAELDDASWAKKWAKRIEAEQAGAS